MAINSAPFEDIGVDDTERISRLYEGTQALWDKFNKMTDPANSPLLDSFNFDKLKPKRLLEINQKGEFSSVQKLGEYIEGTRNHVRVRDLGDGRVKLSLYGDFGPGGPVAGAGTANTVPLWNAFNTLGDSIMTQAGATITVANNLAATTLVAGGTLTIATGSITDSGGSIDFGNENLLTGGYLEFTEIAAPAGNPAVNHGWVYVQDNAGTSDIYFEDDAGTVHNLVTPPGGADTQIQFNDAGAFGANANFVTDKAGIQTTSVAYDTGAAGVYRINTATVLDVAGTDNVLLGVGATHNPGGGAAQNVIIGDSGSANLTGTGNVIIGDGCAETASTTCSSNVLLGLSAGRNLSTGSSNFCAGPSAGFSLNTGQDNVFVGSNAGLLTQDGKDNFALGAYALRYNVSGRWGVAIGRLALEDSLGDRNVGIGQQAGKNISTGENNTCIGDTSGAFCITPNYLTCVGAGTLAGAAGSPTGTTAIGGKAGLFAEGTYNTFVGFESGYSSGGAHSGANNVCIGYRAGYNLNTSHRLYIESNTSHYNTPLIYGEFDNRLIDHNVDTFEISAATADTDITVNFSATTNSGQFLWMEDEDYFKFNDDILLDTSEKFHLRDTAIGIYSQADTYLDLFADGAVRIGDSSGGAPTNYVNINSTGDLSFAGSGGFYPRRISQSAEPASGTGDTQIDTGELIIWRDPDDSKTYIVYNDTTEGIRKVEMT